MWRSLLFFACALRSDGWFWANETSTPDKGPWREWLDSSSPTIARALETVEERAAQARDWAGDLNGVSDGWSFGLILDAILGFFGWAIFGSAWDGVKSGCRRLLQLGAVLVVCLFAHYAWAVAWPVVSLVTALAMAIVCVVRAGIRFLGTCGVAIQRACGGAPEAYGAEYYGRSTRTSGTYFERKGRRWYFGQVVTLHRSRRVGSMWPWTTTRSGETTPW